MDSSTLSRLGNTSFGASERSTRKDCAKNDSEVNADSEKNVIELMSEELKLREAESLESQRRADMALLEAKKITSQYQKEADECNSGMETCVEAKQKLEETLAAQKRLSIQRGR